MSSRHEIKQNMQFAGYDALFGLNEEEKAKIADGQVVDIPLEELYEFKNHPFRVLDDEKMKETVDSIKEHGVLVPGIARPRPEGGYEIIAGHRRKHASELVGNKTMPMIVRDISDDDATIIMVDTNIQREEILPSEKAKSYRMKYDAMKHQGKACGVSLDVIAEDAKETRKTVQRYVWLSRLNDFLLEKVDENKLGFVQGVDISFLGEEEQSWVQDEIINYSSKISTKQSDQIKRWYKEGILTKELLRDILNDKKIVERKVIIKAKQLNDYFESSLSNEEIEEIIISLLDKWKEEGGK